MRKNLLVLAALLLAAPLFAQTNTPVRLAIVAESGDAALAADLLTAQLPDDNRFQLLERDEIDKVYHEQGLSAANRDDIKLGRILGADGLLLLNVVRTSQATNLMARLIAVKPGVVLADGNFHWPLKDAVQWAQATAAGLDLLWPKLSIQTNAAIPLSVVNLRAAIQSAGELETERELKLLAIQRLSQESSFFVLERQKMQWLQQEKDFSAEDSKFWDGSYLLDGIVDQNGYSEDTVTINARLSPPRGGAPLLFAVSGSRTNLAEIVNRLAAKVTELLNVQSTVGAWSADHEAEQYFQEAKWALRWGIYPEAQAAADSAWALGKQDMDCAMVRIQAYEASLDFSVYLHGGFTNPHDSNDVLQAAAENAAPNPPWGLTLRQQNFNGVKDVQYVFARQVPDPKSIDIATHALELYDQFSRNSWNEPLQAGESSLAGSAWYHLGIEDLVAASRVLQDFNFVPEADDPVAGQLADLRALARSVAGWISESPSVHDSYFVGDRLASRDELANTIAGSPNIFDCEANWGCYWEEKPEDTIRLYRKLMGSAAFSYIHQDLWLRPLERPRLAAWNDADKQHLPQLWSGFVQDLSASSNVLWQLEAKAFQTADARDDRQLAECFTNLLEAIFKNQDALVGNNVEVLYLDWGIGGLLEATAGNGIVSETKDSLQRLFYRQDYAKLEAMDQEYWDKTIPELKMRSAFEKQRQYLQENQPYDFFKFVDLFGSRNYSASQAREILPLIITYKSNLLAESKSASGIQKGELLGGVGQVGFLEKDAERVLNPPAPRPPTHHALPLTAAGPAVAAGAPPITTNAPDTVTNAIVAKKFLAIPWQALAGLDPSEHIANSKLIINAYHWCEGKLLMEFRYDAYIIAQDGSGHFLNAREVGGLAAAVFNPETEEWQVVDCSKMNLFPPYGVAPYAVLFHGELFAGNDGEIKKYSFASHGWEVLKISDGNNYELFAVNGHLYAANGGSILEINGDGDSSRILASTRRRPPVSALDSLDNLFSLSASESGPLPPELFSGPAHSLCASIGKDIYCRDGNDWRKLDLPQISQSPDAFEGMAVLRSLPPYGSDKPDNLWIWDLNKPRVQLALCDGPRPHPMMVNIPPPGFRRPPDVAQALPLWHSPAGDRLTDLAATFYSSNFYFLADHCLVTNISGSWTVKEKDGYHAQLVCLSQNFPVPLVVPLKFDLALGRPPLKSLAEKLEQDPWMVGSTWMHFGDHDLFIGQPDSPGVWAVPISEIESALSAQKTILKEQLAREEATRKKAHDELIAKYDRNHNGVIDPDEKEEALDDPAFIESELDKIDTNHDGWLEAGELIYFDANHNQLMDPKEQAGIDIAQHLLAVRLLRKYDAEGKGYLDPFEFEDLRQSCLGIKPGAARRMPAPNINSRPPVDLQDLENFLKEQTSKTLRLSGSTAAVFNEFRSNDSLDRRQLFKWEVEYYWKNSGSHSN